MKQEKQSQRETAAIGLYNKNDFDGAEKICAKLLSVDSRNLLALNIRSAVQLHKQNFKGAEATIRNALRLHQNADAFFNLGLACKGQGKIDEAIDAYQNCLLLSDHPRAGGNLANLLTGERHFDEAEALYRKAIKNDPGYGFAWSNLGGLLVKNARYAEAEPVLRQAIALLPDLKASYAFLGDALEKQKKPQKAIAVYKTMGAQGRIIDLMRQQADWHGLAGEDAAFLENPFPEHLSPSPSWPAIMVPGVTPELHREMGRRFALFEYADSLAAPLRAFAAHNGSRLKIGYLSADFSNHATMHLLSGVLETHNPEVVDVHLFSYGPELDDAYTTRIRAMPVTRHDVRHLSDRLAAAEIAGANIDVLVDLKGYTTNGRPGISAFRPAPTVVSWLGYPGSLGHERLADFIIGDSVVTPVEHAAHFSETIAMMPFCYQPNDSRRTSGTELTRTDAGLPGDGMVFCCFNQIRKINPVDFDIWCRLLQAVPGSIIWLMDPKDERTRNNLQAEMQARGVNPGRLVFAPFCALPEHIGRLRLADIFLDTQQCNAHTTASDALWAGVPVITTIGDLFASRVAASLLVAHGFSELIATDAEQYFELALALALDPLRLGRLRERLQAARLQSPLFDTKTFTRDLERLYMEIWRQQAVPRQQRKPIVLTRQMQSAA